MQFALLGDHPDGLGMAKALTATGNHTLVCYCGAAAGMDRLREGGLSPRQVGDVEEVLADPAVQAVVVAGKRAERSLQLRRVVQSERHALCVPFGDDRLDLGYEVQMEQADKKVVLLPLLAEALHPGVLRLAELASTQLGSMRLLESERWATTPLDGEPTTLAALPGWDVLRRVGGDVAELFTHTRDEEMLNTEPLLLGGRFASGALLSALFLPGRAAPRVRLAVQGMLGHAELVFPEGWSGSARLCWHVAGAEPQEENWEPWNPWPLLVEAFERTLAAPREPQTLTWQDAIRALELDDAVRRSLKYRRLSTLEYPEASEEVGFKGTMTLVGCGMLWLMLLLLILSNWFPWLGWLIAPALVFFLGLQVLRWVVPRRSES